MAGFHSQFSAYIALGGLLQNRELLRLVASLTPVEMMHSTVFATSLAEVQASAGTGTGGGTGDMVAHLRSLRR